MFHSKRTFAWLIMVRHEDRHRKKEIDLRIFMILNYSLWRDVQVLENIKIDNIVGKMVIAY